MTMLTADFKTSSRLGAYSRRSGADGTHVWIRVGSAQLGDDGELTVTLNLVPFDGLLHLRSADAPVLSASFDDASAARPSVFITDSH